MAMAARSGWPDSMDRPTTVLALAVLLATSCVGKPNDASGRRGGERGTTSRTADAPAASARPEFVKATAAGAVLAELVQESRRKADADGRRLVVYVGATWCEPCQRFHEAVEAGELDADLAGVRFLEFDSDEDGDALRDGGYGGRLIPRFALPGPDGRGTAAKVEGGPKGDGAVTDIVERLRPLLARAGA